MDAAKRTYQIVGQKLLSWFDSQILVDWAYELLQNGFDSESLRILAGLNHSDTEEREKYFWKSIDELNITIDKNETELISFYVKHLTDEVLSGTIPPKYALERMSRVTVKTDYD